jgi:hypothetical protein
MATCSSNMQRRVTVLILFVQIRCRNTHLLHVPYESGSDEPTHPRKMDGSAGPPRGAAGRQTQLPRGLVSGGLRD